MKAAAKGKILNVLLILSSLMGYLEWGKDKSSFLFQAEGEVLSRLLTDFASAIHPFTVLPLVGQMLLLATLFQRQPGKVLTFAGIVGVGVLLGLMFVIGLLSLNYRIVLSTLPFLAVAFFTMRNIRDRKS